MICNAVQWFGFILVLTQIVIRCHYIFAARLSFHCIRIQLLCAGGSRVDALSSGILLEEGKSIFILMVIDLFKYM